MSNTSSTGSPVNSGEQAAAPRTSGQKATSALVLLGAAALLIFALFAGTQIVAVLYGLIYPPLPPVLDSMKEVGHVSEAHGVDVWRYVTDTSSTELAAFYAGQGANCVVHGPRTYIPDRQLQMICTARTTFSIFTMNWDVVIIPEQPQNVVRLAREVFWIGAPPATN